MSMISHQIDELRELAKGLRMLDYPKDAQKVDSAIYTIQALSEKVADQNLKNSNEKLKSENPCGKCQMSLMEKSTCCGCPERIEWEKQYKQKISSATSQNLTEPNKNCEVDLISRQAVLDEIDDVSDVCEEIGQIEWCAELRTRVISISSAQKPMLTEEAREALLRLTMCAREECKICKYEKECDFSSKYERATKNMNIILDELLSQRKRPECGAKMKGENK